VRNSKFLRFFPFEVICRPAPTRIFVISISGAQIFEFYTKQEKKVLETQEKKEKFLQKILKILLFFQRQLLN
jgi:hypothetical protein